MPHRNPFPGLRPFSSDESELFFGRERHINEIIRKLNSFRFVSIVGNSGSGKSSLVRAGLLPALDKDPNPWNIAVMRPGEAPIRKLKDALLANTLLKGKLPDGKEIEQTLEKNALGLVQVLRSALEGQRFLLLVDQFEEIFRFRHLDVEDDDVEFELDKHFVDLLLNAVGQNDVPIYVILTLRSDFLGDCEQFMGLPEAINDGQFLIPRMNKDELRSCITGPIKLAGEKVSPQLVQHLVDEVGNSPDRLPVLQHILMRTWEVWDDENDPDSPIDVGHYDQTGGMENALNIHAEEAYGDLKTDKDREIAESLFRTITIKGNDNRGIRRPTAINKIAQIAGVSPGDVIRVADVFRREDRGFIMPPGNVRLEDDSVLDISHESLMRVWHRLAEWVDEEAESAELYMRISNNAMLYEEDKAGLWRDPDLQIALDWRDTQNHNEVWASQYNDNFKLAQVFINASYNEKQFQVAEVQRRKKVQRVAIIVFLVSLSALSIWAFTERNSSMDNERKAVAEKQESEKQKRIAEEQKAWAEKNLDKAIQEEKRAQAQTIETQNQRNIALERAEEARMARLKAEIASREANAAKESAVLDRNRAETQRQISDSLRTEAEESERLALRLQMLSLAQTMAIKSKQAQDYTFDESVKSLLALQAYDLTKKYGGDPMDPDIFSALYQANRAKQNQDNSMLSAHRDALKSIAFMKNSNMVASVGNDGVIIITSADKEPLSYTSTDPVPLFFDNVTFSPDGKFVAVSADNKSILIYNSANLKAKPDEIKGIHEAEIMDIIWNRNLLITACLDKTIRIFKDRNSHPDVSVQLDARPLAMAIDNSGTKLIVGCDNGTVYTVNTGGNEAPQVLVKVGKGRINGLCMNARSTLFAVGTDQGYAAVYKIDAPKQPVSVLSGHKAGITGLVFHPSANYLATSSLDKVVRLWNVDELNPKPIEFKEHDNWVMDVAFNSDGTFLASAGRDKTLWLYPVHVQLIAEGLRKTINRQMSKEEWIQYVSDEIPYDTLLN